MSNFDEIEEIDLPSMSENQQEYLQEQQETSFTNNAKDQQTTKTRVRELSKYLGENIQFRKGGELKDLTNWDGTFKQQSASAWFSIKFYIYVFRF